MKQGNIYFTFEGLKEMFNFPKDALLKNIEANNIEGTVTISFYTNDDNYYNVTPGTDIPRKKINSL